MLYVETDDSCGVCGIRGNERLTIHHIDGDSANNGYDNQIVICYNCHQQHHQRRTLKQRDIQTRKRHLIRKTLTQYGVNAMIIAARNNFGVVAMPFLLYHLVQLGYMTKEEEVMAYGEQNDSTARFAITDAGRKVLLKWLR